VTVAPHRALSRPGAITKSTIAIRLQEQ